MHTLDIVKLVERLGGRQALAKKLTESALCRSVSVKGIEKWCERQTMPLSRLLDCMVLSRKAGKSIDVNKLIQKKGN
jgi:hypothetical protein